VTSSPPVNPHDQATVGPIFAATMQAMGIGGVGDLLSRLPGTRVDPGRPARFFSPAVPPSVTLGAEHQLLLTEPPEYVHRVGGVVLHRRAVPPGELPGLLAGLVSSLTREQGSEAETTAVLSVARDVLDGV